MKKIYTLAIALILATFAFSSEYINLDGINHRIDTTAVYPIGPSSKYIAMTLTRPDGKVLHVYQTIIDKSNKYIDCEVLMGRDSILWGEPIPSVAKRHSYEKHNIFAATNGDFYITKGDVGLPTGTTISCNQLAHTPNNRRKTVGFDENNIPYIGVTTFNGLVTRKGETLKINHVNYNRADNELVLYNQLQGKFTRTNQYGTEVSIELCKGESWGMNKTIKAIVTGKAVNSGNSSIEKGKAVLSGHGTAAEYLNKFNEGDSIILELNTLFDDKQIAISNCTGAEPRSLMLKDGKVEQNDVWDQLHPRTGFGYSITKDSLISCVVDGRGKSIGCTTKVLAEIMKSAGAYTAVNLDGGGSSTMYVYPFGAMNTCSDGSERAVCNGIHYINNAPTDNNISSISATINHIVLPPYGTFKPHILGYNQYGALINTNVEDFTLECDESVGYIQNNELIASGLKDGFLTIKYKDAICKVHIIKNNDAEVEIRLDSVIIDGKWEYPIEVQSIIDHNKENILPEALEWTVEDNSICSVENGILRGLKNGVTYVFGALGSKNDTLKVIVEIPEERVLVAEKWDETTGKEWVVKSTSSKWNAKLINATESKSANIEFNYTGGRSPFIQIEGDKRLYSLPDKLQFTFNPKETSIIKVSLSILPNYYNKAIVVDFENIRNDEEQTVTVDLKKIVEKSDDIANYPLVLNYIKFYLNGSNMGKNKTYSIELKDVKLIYDYLTIDVENVKEDNGFNLYPNPAEKIIHVSNEMINEKYAIYSVNGQCVKCGILKDDSINISSLDSGSYIIKINNKTAKFIIK